MAPLTIPPDLKRIAQFIRRAEELDLDTSHKESRVVAYYCRQHAVEVGLPLAGSAESKQCLGDILNELEGEKKAMSVFSREESKRICRFFADRCMKKVSDEMESSLSMGEVGNKGTAKRLYAAATYYEILSQFRSEGEEEGPEKAEEDEKRIFCKQKAMEILNATG